MEKDNCTVLECMESVRSTLKREGRYASARLCSSSRNSFARFLEERKEAEKSSASVRRLNCGLLKEYETWLYSHGKSDNTTSSYLRALRASYYRMSRECHFAVSPFLFKNVYTGVRSTNRRAVAGRSIGRVLSGDVQFGVSSLQFVCVLFSLQFLLCGMPYIDLYHLRKTDLQGNILTYRRHKTGVEITLVVPPDAMRLLRLYADTNPASPYLIAMNREAHLPAGKKMPKAELEDYVYCHSLRNYNAGLHRLSMFLRTGEKLNSYTPRYTWANIAFHINVPIGAISRVLGHTSIKTTEFYLEPFGEKEIDRVNDKIIKLVKTKDVMLICG